MPAFLANLLVFARLLRTQGLDVDTGRCLDLVAALPLVDVTSRDDVYYACRAVFVQRREDLAIFDLAFDAWYHEALEPRRESQRREDHEPRRNEEEPRRNEEHEEYDESRGVEGTTKTRRHEEHKQGEAVPQTEDVEDAAEDAVAAWSDAARLAAKDFAAFTADEIALAQAAFERLEWAPEERKTRRWVAGRGPRLDLRRALARSVRTGGDIVQIPRRRRRTKPRSLVLLCDISGSMEAYSRLLLHFAHAIGQRYDRVEAFVFSSRLTRITPALRTRRLDTAVSAVSAAVPDWSGGTRIGEALRHLHQRWARRVLHRGPIVLLISDGWDRGEPDVLRDQIKRLQRLSHRLIWLNPLAGTEGYLPLTRGLQAALPFVDDFLPARTLANFADLALHLNTLRDAKTWKSPAPTRSTRRAIGSGRF